MNVQFPGLGLEFDIERVAFSIGSIDIYWYAVIILTGFALAVLYAFRRAKYFGIEKDPMFDVVLIGFICAIIGARLYYVIFSGHKYENIIDVFNIRDGGLAIYGAVICAFLSGVITCLWRRIRIMAMFDIAGIGFLIGQSIGRWGNFMNQEAFGDATDLPWGMLSANTMKIVPDSPVHPCFLYESLWCAAGLLMLHILSKKCYKFYGQFFLLYLLWYGLGRAWIEGLRTDSLWLIPDVIRVSQLLAVLSLLTIPLLVLGFRGKLFTQRITDKNGNAINAMVTANAGAAVAAGVTAMETASAEADDYTAEEEDYAALLELFEEDFLDEENQPDEISESTADISVEDEAAAVDAADNSAEDEFSAVDAADDSSVEDEFAAVNNTQADIFPSDDDLSDVDAEFAQTTEEAEENNETKQED